MRPIPWNFAKFLIDQEGRVVKYYSPKVPPSQILPDIKEVLAGTKQGPPSQPATISAEAAPPGFLSSRPQDSEKPHLSANGTAVFTPE
mmetsp:Transcript_30839/g.57835  ORF Transcript_30839/g.57835 Transcript_30839/m.57835 type:complete len:88 (-) Transcript_30839:55-318(-)